MRHDLQGIYIHSKTGNRYVIWHQDNDSDELADFVEPKAGGDEQVDPYAKDSVLYRRAEFWTDFYSKEYESLSTKELLPVLADKWPVWARSKADFLKLVDINGVMVPRFKKAKEQ